MAIDNHAQSNGIGTPVMRSEDHRLLTGAGNYAGDFFPDAMCHAVMVRSPHAHAKICSINATQAMSAPDVLAVLTGVDAATDGLSAIPHSPDWVGPPDAILRLPDGFEVYTPKNIPLPVHPVPHVGHAAPAAPPDRPQAAAGSG